MRARGDRLVPLVGCERALVLGMLLAAQRGHDEVTRAAIAELLHQLVRARPGSELGAARLAIAGFTAAALRAQRWS
jgi:hypothetical protein